MLLVTSINNLLERAAGVRVLRAERVRKLISKAQSAQEALRKRDAEIQRLKDQLAPKSATPAKAAKPQLPADYDRDFAPIWESVQDRTMTGHAKVYGLYHAVRYIIDQNIPGAIVECGVWRGGSMLAVTQTLERLGVADRDLYLFDTYEGMTEPTERDIHIGKHTSARAQLASGSRNSWVWAIASLEDVKQGFEQVNYPPDRIHFVKGPVESTVPGQAPEQIAILRLDTDWYASTKHELRQLYHRLAPGGVLIIDDYGTWQGAKDATDEFVTATGEPLLLVRAGQGRIAVKPGLPTEVSGPSE